MSENIYKKARLKAAKTNSSLRTVEHAHPFVCLGREKMLAIEQTDPSKKMADPDPAEVIMMAKAYNAPELCDYYCSTQCPIGKDDSPLIYDDLGKISASLMSSLHFLESANDEIHSILADSEVADTEADKFRRIIKTLDDIVYSAESLKLWAKKNGYVK